MEKYLSKQQVQDLIDKAPTSIPTEQIIQGLVKRGYQLEGLEQPKPVEQPKDKESILGGLATGVGKGVLSTFKGISQVGEDIGQGMLSGVEKLTGLPVTQEKVYTEEALQKNAEEGGLGKILTEETLAPKTTLEKIGKTGEQIAEFFIPAGLASKANKAVDLYKGEKLLSKLTSMGINENTAQKLVSAGKIGAKSLIGAGEMGGVSLAQTGEIGTETGISAGIGAISPILSAGIKSLKPAVASTLEFTSGVPKEAIKKAMSGNEAVKLGMNMTTEQVRDNAVKAYKALDSEVKSSFSKGLDELSKLSPRQGMARTAKIGGTSVFSGVKGQFKNLIEKARENIPQTFRDLRISVSKNGKLDFDKLNSSIVNANERKQIQQVWDTIRNQKDFSVKGVQDVASKINALSKYEKGLENVSSVAIGKMHNTYSKAIEKIYPELGKLRSNYATSSKMLSEIDDVIRSGASTPTQIQSAISKLTNLYKTDKQTYLNVIENLSQKSGVDVSGLLSGTEFSKVLPSFVRGIGGGGALAASATLLNPLTLLLFPLFSPKLIGKAITTAPKIGKVASKIPAKEIITGAIAQTQ